MLGESIRIGSWGKPWYCVERPRRSLASHAGALSPGFRFNLTLSPSLGTSGRRALQQRALLISPSLLLWRSYGESLRPASQGTLGRDFPSNPAAVAEGLIKFEQRICIKFCFKIGKSASETLYLLKLAFGNENVNKPTTFRWFS
ncbi:hypothetical protein LAZ67_5004333 [Cordylochernes scorpioides]|uniref:Mos1 transposase HTH domain-containing protein n=1 Tax=Cordylochernes scorpioides TaxID=51811 RepID=A0ABY6KL07_9ARAC|nr:hypothetical protein LAZ67_5004333 [Cordylochernes scorpioides]